MSVIDFRSFREGIHHSLERVPTASLALILILLVFLHNPHALLHAEFWGEDGPVWYGQARDSGLLSLLRPEGGYLNSLQRLPALAVQPFSLVVIPTIFVLFAIIVQASPAIFLVSNRMSAAWPGRSSRVLFAFFFVMMPNAPETALNVTNSQWYLAILAFLVIVSAVPQTRRASIFDSVVLVISGLSGPFCVLFSPIALLRAVHAAPSERRARIVRLLLVGATALVQVLLILGLSHQGRATGPLGADFHVLVKILAMIPLGAEIGYTGVGVVSRAAAWASSDFSAAVVSISALIFFASLWKGPRILKEFTFFAVILLALALSKPLVSLTEPQWPLLTMQPAGNRYFLYPMMAWWGGLFALVATGERLLRAIGAALLALAILVAVPLDWGDLFKIPRTDFVARVRQFEGSQPGTVGRFNIHPPGVVMELTQKKQPKLSDDVPFNAAWFADGVAQSKLCALDRVNDDVAMFNIEAPATSSISMVGWALSSQAKKPREVTVVLRGAETYAYSASHGVFRDDVVSSLGGHAARASGYASTVSAVGLRPGTYRIELITRTKAGFERCDTGKAITFKNTFNGGSE